MADETKDRDETEGSPEAGAPEESAATHSSEDAEAAPGGEEKLATTSEEGDLEEEDELLPAQLAHRRYVYAVFFAIGIAVAYFASKAGLALWHRLSQWTPKVGEPREDLVTPVAAIISAVLVFIVYRREDVRTLSDEVALELSKTEWPTREMVRRSTTIVVGATLGSSLAFWLYDIGTNRAVTFVTSSDHPVLYGLVAGLVIYLIRLVGVRFLVGSS